MRCAPGVVIDLTRPCPYWRRGLLALGGFVVPTLLGWMVLHWQVDLGDPAAAGSASVAHAAPVLAVGAIGALMVAAVLRTPVPTGLLIWNTVQWQWRAGPDSGPDPLPGTTRIALDLGAWLLIAFEPLNTPHTTLWLPVARATAGDAWHGLNCALRQGASAIPARTQTDGPNA